jgi:uncharacterized protein (TIGR02391 family)
MGLYTLRVVALVDDIKLLQVLDDFEQRNGAGLLPTQMIYEAAVPQRDWSQETASGFAHELVIARDAGYVTFIEDRPPGWNMPIDPRSSPHQWLQSCVRNVALTSAGRDRARGRVVVVDLPVGAEDDGRSISKLTLTVIVRALKREYSQSEMTYLFEEQGLAAPEVRAVVGARREDAPQIVAALASMLDGGADARRRLRSLIGSWLAGRLPIRPTLAEHREVIRDLARQGWHLDGGTIVIGEAVFEPPDTSLMLGSDGFHPAVWEVARIPFEKEEFAHACSEALKSVEHTIQLMTGSGQTGIKLIGVAFGGKPPRISLNAGKDQSDHDEQDGYQFLFRGVVSGLRNPLTHRRRTELTKQETLEIVGLASLLMRKLDVAAALAESGSGTPGELGDRDAR